MNQHIENSINKMKEVQQRVEEAVSEQQAESTDTENTEAPQQSTVDPVGNVLFNQITESTIKIMQSPEIEKSLVLIGENMKMDEKSIAALINVIAIAMTNSAHQAILFYDDLLKAELGKQFDNVGHHINLGKADMEAFKSVLQVHQKQMNEIKTALKLADIKKENEASHDSK